jgi:hypothetical protein
MSGIETAMNCTRLYKTKQDRKAELCCDGAVEGADMIVGSGEFGIGSS